MLIFKRLIDRFAIGDPVPAGRYSKTQVSQMLRNGLVVEVAAKTVTPVFDVDELRQRAAENGFDSLKVNELTVIAAEDEIEGYAKMRKAELVEALSGDN